MSKLLMNEELVENNREKEREHIRKATEEFLSKKGNKIKIIPFGVTKEDYSTPVTRGGILNNK